MRMESPFTTVQFQKSHSVKLTFLEPKKVLFNFENVKINGIFYSGCVYFKQYDSETRWVLSDHYMRRDEDLGALTSKAWGLVYDFCYRTMQEGNFSTYFKDAEAVNKRNKVEGLKDLIKLKQHEICETEKEIDQLLKELSTNG